MAPISLFEVSWYHKVVLILQKYNYLLLTIKWLLIFCKLLVLSFWRYVLVFGFEALSYQVTITFDAGYISRIHTAPAINYIAYYRIVVFLSISLSSFVNSLFVSFMLSFLKGTPKINIVFVASLMPFLY